MESNMKETIFSTKEILEASISDIKQKILSLLCSNNIFLSILKISIQIIKSYIYI